MSDGTPAPPDGVVKVGMPKWGLSMTEGKVVGWLVDEGDEVAEGQELAEVETEKINGEVEAPAAGVLRRRVGEAGATIPVGGLLAVIAEPDVDDADIDAFVAAFQDAFVPEEETEAAGPQPVTLEVDGTRLRYLDTGDGDETVVLLHGFGGDLDNWLFTQPALAEHRRVIALDLPGHGQSTKDVGDGDLASFAGLVRAALAELGATDVHLVGHSMGGGVAARLAADGLDGLRTLTLVAPTGLGSDINDEFVSGFIAANRRREMKGVLELLFADPELVTRRLVQDVMAFKRFDGVDEALRTIAAAQFPNGAQSEDVVGALAAIDVPVLVVWGADDRVLPAGQAEAARDHARVDVLDGAGHSPHMERAGDVNRLLERFWSEV